MTLASALALVPAANATDTVNNVWGAVFSGTGGILGLIFYVLFAIAMWRIFTKAGYAGILAIIPIVNIVFLVKIAGMSGWFALLYLIPIVNVIFNIVVAIRLGRNFGKGGAFSFFLLWLFSIIGYFILGFGSAQYRRV
ncbi:DUF5684 domain-containing protein [Microbacterium capsulatum]|uniref:DUF5684 domain-containing protein n=1 Tax=Microbacterium capsulatum TaxID=3041921 RepID=A0ABU0XKH5_9MICO|nr:DUF5684 domain-containing protein [Microbacterium sp. ASV81]MDQ4215654.1 DUF5684 domain-containing protein [Microbacterium sp. ASV81]